MQDVDNRENYVHGGVEGGGKTEYMGIPYTFHTIFLWTSSCSKK